MMQRRPYGATGEELSVIGMGGIVVAGLPQTEADRAVREAFDRGIDYFDVAPSYADAEERLGPALVGLRDRVFLACKTGQRKRDEAAVELRRSLERLKTDRFDLYQLHGLTSVEEVETCFGPGGAMEAFVEARDAGLVRHLGFSAHSEDAALAALDRFKFDSVLFPLNFRTYGGSGFGKRVLARAEEMGTARLALKAMARRPWPEGAEREQPNCWYQPLTDRRRAELALRWTLSLPITAAIPPGDPALFRLAIDLAEDYAPLSPAERAEIESAASEEQPIFA